MLFRSQIKVIIVIVGQQDEINWRQVFQGNAGGTGAFGTGKGNRAGAFGKERVGKDIKAANLDQHCGVTNHGDRKIFFVMALWRLRVTAVLDLFWPLVLFAENLPFQQAGDACWPDLFGQEKSCAVKMVTDRTLIIGVDDFFGHIWQLTGCG